MHGIVRTGLRGLAGARAGHVRTRGLTTEPPKPKRVNPYRFPPLTTFLGAFAPLHAAGWRLETLDPQRGVSSGNAATDLLSGADLQNKIMTRAYGFSGDRDGWTAASKLLAGITAAIEGEDHHPKLTIGPYNDLPESMRDICASDAGYVLHVATHTHTPLPPLGAEGAAFDGKPQPGVTYKDLRLAERIEALVEE